MCILLSVGRGRSCPPNPSHHQPCSLPPHLPSGASVLVLSPVSFYGPFDWGHVVCGLLGLVSFLLSITFLRTTLKWSVASLFLFHCWAMFCVSRPHFVCQLVTLRRAGPSCHEYLRPHLCEHVFFSCTSSSYCHALGVSVWEVRLMNLSFLYFILLKEPFPMPEF